MAETGTTEIMQLLDQIISRYKPGGGFGVPEEALLKRAKVKSLAGTAQQQVTSGLAGTTVGMGSGRLWEEEVGMPARLQLEDTRTQRLMEAMGAKAGYLEHEEASTLQNERSVIQWARERAESRHQQEAADELERYRIDQMGSSTTTEQGGGGSTYGADTGGTGGSYGGVGDSYSPYGTYGTGTGTGGGGSMSDPFAGQPVYGPGGEGLYLGDNKALSPEQIGSQPSEQFESDLQASFKAETNWKPTFAEWSAKKRAAGQRFSIDMWAREMELLSQ